MMVIIIKLFSTESVDDELTNECVSCGEYANVFRDVCKSSSYKTCNKQRHKHPKRRNHNTKVKSK